ncbi:MAG: GPW/gp25 family protein [bacterium]
MAQVSHPFHVDSSGRTARAGPDQHVAQMVRQVLFTAPGERVNLPEFGCGLDRLVFAPNSDALAAATRVLVIGALDRWLGDIITVDDVRITNPGEKLVVDVAYRIRRTGDAERLRFDAGRPEGGGQ